MKVYTRNYDEARVLIEKAIASNPNETETRAYYAVYLTASGQAHAAIEQLDLSKRQNPFDLAWTPWIRGGACFAARRYDEAIAVLNNIP